MKAFLLFIFTIPSLAIAADLSTVDLYLGVPDWQRSFQKPQRVLSIFVEQGSFGTTRTKYLDYAALTSPTEIKISTTDTDGKEVSSFALQKSDWENRSGNWIRFFMEQTESYGYRITVEEVTSIKTDVQINGVNKTVSALKIRASGKNQLGWALEQIYIISNEPRGIGQLLLREETQSAFGANILRQHQVLSIED